MDYSRKSQYILVCHSNKCHFREQKYECEVKGYISPVFLPKIALFLMFAKLVEIQFYLVLVQKIVAVRN